MNAARQARRTLESGPTTGTDHSELSVDGLLARAGELAEQQPHLAVSLADRAAAQALARGDRMAHATALRHRGIALKAAGQFGEAARVLVSGLQAALEVGDTYLELSCRHGLAMALKETGELAAALDLLAVLLQRARAVRHTKAIAVALTGAGLVFDELGEHERALVYHRESYRTLRAEGPPYAQALLNCGVAHGHAGRHRHALRFAQWALREYRRNADAKNEALALANVALACAHLQRRAEADAALDTALTISATQGFERQHAVALLHGAEMRRPYDAALAEQRYRQAYELAERLGAAELARRAARGAGEMAAATGCAEDQDLWEQRLRGLEDAVREQARQAGDELRGLRIELELAQAQATRALAQQRTLLRLLHGQHHVVLASHRAAGSRERVSGAGRLSEKSPSLAPVSRREQQVLRLLVDGLPNARIAQQLGVSEHTVRHQVSSVLRKLGVKTRAAAVSLAMKSGWR